MHAIYIATVHTKQNMETATVTLKDVSSSSWPKESFPCSVSWTSSVFSQWVFRFLCYPKRENSICFFLIPQSVNLSIFLDLRGEKVRCQKRWDAQRCLLSSIMSPVFGIRTKLVSNKMSTEISFKFRLKIFVFLFFFFFFNIVFFLPFFFLFIFFLFFIFLFFFFFFSPAVPNCGFKMEVSEYQEMRLFSGFPIKKPD